jgi:hypothetical protein
MFTVKGMHLADYFGNTQSLKCYTDYITVKSKDDETVKRRIADAMALCWDQYGQGKGELFDTRDNNYCAICSQLTFKNKKTVSGLTEFLMKEKPTVVSSESYFEYLTSVEANDDSFRTYENSELKKKGEDVINLENPLAVIFMMDKDAYPDGKLLKTGKLEGAAIGAGGGLAASFIIGLLLCTTGVGCFAGIGVIGSAAVIALAGAGGSKLGYAAGSDHAAEWDARIVLWDYNKLDQLSCTKLEGKATPLDLRLK